jgi:hypothetical protein
MDGIKEQRRHNKRLAKKRFKCSNEVFYCVENLVLRNTLLNRAA